MTNNKEELDNIVDDLTKRIIEVLNLKYYNVKYNIEGIDVELNVDMPLSMVIKNLIRKNYK